MKRIWHVAGGLAVGYLTLRYSFAGWWKVKVWKYNRDRVRDRQCRPAN